MTNCPISDFDEEKYEKLTNDLDEIFPNCPFNISCIEDIKELDETFTEEKTIIIKDDRASETNYYYSEFNKNQLVQYVDYLVIKQKDNKPITLRQILTEMSNSPHYNDEVVIGDDHRFLEFFEQNTDIEYTMFFGS